MDRVSPNAVVKRPGGNRQRRQEGGVMQPPNLQFSPIAWPACRPRAQRDFSDSEV